MTATPGATRSTRRCATPASPSRRTAITSRWTRRTPCGYAPSAPQAWLALTRDQRIRHRPNEIAAVRAARLHLFVLSSGNLGAADTGAIAVAAWTAIQRGAASREPPAVWSVSRSAQVRLLKV
ncbi:MAG: hypothetical protein O9321_08880 [Rubrivivax sp.]|nr:hypothetical protein [Rubrivivax sp.]